MSSQIGSILVRRLGVVSSLLIPIKAAIADATNVSGGMMGNEHWYGTGGVWMPALIVVVLGVVLFAVVRTKK